jgi:tetrahydromethanopterin S-methyltransferase subunit F
VTLGTGSAADPVEAAVAVLLRDGGEIELETDRLNAPEASSRLHLRYNGKDHGRAVLGGWVIAFVGRQGPALESLGWVREPLAEMQAPDRARVEQAEVLHREHGTDYRLMYTRRWDLPPSTQRGVAADLRATLRAFDDRPVEDVRYDVRRDGPLDQETVFGSMVFGCFSLLAGCLAAGLLVIIPRNGGSDLATRAGIAGIVAWLAVFYPGQWLLARLPGAGKWGWIPLWIAMLVLPAAAVIGWALWGW